MSGACAFLIRHYGPPHGDLMRCNRTVSEHPITGEGKWADHRNALVRAHRPAPASGVTAGSVRRGPGCADADMRHPLPGDEIRAGSNYSEGETA